jgi:hypothetical protein
LDSVEAGDAHVAPGDGPFAALFDEHGAYEAGDCFAVGEDAHDVGAASEFFVEVFLGVVGPDLAPVLFGERCEGQPRHRRRRRGGLRWPGTARRVGLRLGCVGSSRWWPRVG